MAQKNPNSILNLTGIGPKKAELFAKLGVDTMDDLLHLYPRDYEDRTRMLPIASLEVGTPACFIASVISTPMTHRIPKPDRRSLEITKLTVADHTGKLNLTFFNSSYSVERLHRGESYVFYGTLVGDYIGYAMTNPLFEPLDSYGKVTRCIVPIYPLTAGLTNNNVASAVKQALGRCSIQETIPEDIRREYGLWDAQTALRQIHQPSDQEALAHATRRLVFEEFYCFSAALSILRSKRSHKSVPPYHTEPQAFYETLPFSLTGAQRRVIEEILADFRSGNAMSRLVQGDVGCGKTMVAAAAAFVAIENHKQVAFMAPTEILAKQHFERLAPLFASLGQRVSLLTGSMKLSEKKRCRDALAAGEIDLLIGTHALLTEATVFSDLGLVIADEQHRFGVAQRAALLSKGEQPHLLIMSATPIPRTLALILYGDLDVSVVDELPPGRQQVDSFLVDERYRKRLNDFIRKQAAEGHQTFIVCPAIEEGETESLKAAELWAQTLQSSVFPNLRVALLHGKMKGAEKDQVMEAFAAGAYDILVSTTVIEVGVDVPNATLMVVENADRFGLSQLHQLRGRIGRGSAKSYCILVSDNHADETRQRLKALCKTTDGFRIAQEDLKLRGPGDFFGSRQHGLPLFRMGSLTQDLGILQEAQEAAAKTISADRPLPPALEKKIRSLLEQESTLN
ncbi:MAG: ATP-dependent DNA helicase RecG [Oscillospiraceae bacterium]|nr:ATP-dependent DNA helicase RecG [Oscillospiraceae bacterium]